jgi:ribosomal protein S24E
MTTIDFEVKRPKSQTEYMNILTTQYLENPLLGRHQTFYTVHHKKLITLMGYEVNASKVKGQTGHKKVLTAQYLDNPLLDGHQILYTGTW